LYVTGTGELAPKVTMTLGTMSKEFALCANGEVVPKADGLLTAKTLGIAWIAVAMKSLVAKIGSTMNIYDTKPHPQVHLCASKPNTRCCNRTGNHSALAATDNALPHAAPS
jgi:hypothetical protein